MEEYEKNDSRVPKWKVEWVRENLSTMIGKEDCGMKKQKTLKSPIKGRKSLSKKQSKLEEDDDVDLS